MKQFCVNGHDTFICGRSAHGCLQCKKDQQKAWSAANPDRRRALQRKSERRHILGLPEHEPARGSPCDVCGEPMLETPRADHDHQTLQFRGWTHNRCNLGLEHLDRPGWVERALVYKAAHEKRYPTR